MRTQRLTSLVIVAVLLVAGSILSACDPPPPTLTGTLRDSLSGAPLVNVAVAAYADSSQTVLAQSATDASGHYSFSASALPTGSYRLRFSTSDWWRNAADWSTATPVAVETGTTATVSDSLVAARGAISGTVTDGAATPAAGLSGATVQALSTVTGITVSQTSTDASGNYTLSGLPTGAYLVMFTRTGYATRFEGSVDTQAAAVPVAVSADSTATADTTLLLSATITGTVTDGLDLLDGVDVAAVDATTGATVAMAVTQNGTFSLEGLHGTGVHLVLTDPRGALRTQVWGSTSSVPSTGTTFAPGAGATLAVGTQQMVGAACDRSLLVPGANNSGLDLNGANLTNCDLSGEALDHANLQGTILTHADLANSTLTAANLRSSTLVAATLDGADLSSSDLTGAVVSAGSVAATQFGGAALAGVRSGSLRGVPAGLPAGWTLTRRYLVGPGADLENAGLSGASLAGRDLSGADLTFSDLTNADLTGATLTGTNIQNATLGGAMLAGANVHGMITGLVHGAPGSLPTGWQAPSIDGGDSVLPIGPYAVLTGAGVSTANLVGIDLTGVDFGNASTYYLYLGGNDVTGAHLARLTFSVLYQFGPITGVPADLPPGWSLVNGTLVGP